MRLSKFLLNVSQQEAWHQTPSIRWVACQKVELLRCMAQKVPENNHCLHAIAEIQKTGGTAAFIDAEHALTQRTPNQLGVLMLLKVPQLSQPDNGEQSSRDYRNTCSIYAVDLVVVDSVAALVPQK